MEYVEPIREPGKIRAIAKYIQDHNKEKFYVMFMMGIYSGLRISDILELHVSDVRINDKIVDVVKVRAKKTNKVHQFPINARLRSILYQYCSDLKDYDYLIYSYQKNKPISRVRAWKVLKDAGEYVGVRGIGTHSMRKTFGYHFYQKTGDVVTLQKIFGHSHPSVTLRYIGVDDDNILEKMRKFDYEF